MKATLLACALIAATASAQDIAPKDSERDPLLAALSENLDEEPAVTVDIRSTAPPMVPTMDSEAPVLVTGKPSEVATETGEPVAEPEGVTVNVEPGSAGSSAVDAKSVKLLAPFPAKPLSHPPKGWRLEHPKEVPAFTREVPLSNGTHIQLSIRPHLLVPDADGAHVIAVKEPGYEPDKRYAQTGTMSAVLSTSIDQLDQDARQMSEAIDRLEQLLGSLPATEAAAPRATIVNPPPVAPNRKPTR
ncbi:hypothetical protein [Haloferula sp. BvORR071]|uniref:hypothetical protein n=1 Tax=Haloferula sp. BvORR071 TaxID=1396141 RepID=UPI000558A5C6|nr:hypothetical protein [Haloferula sp. BvORR071]